MINVDDDYVDDYVGDYVYDYKILLCYSSHIGRFQAESRSFFSGGQAVYCL